MTIKEIEILLEKYFESRTSIEEERQLKDFFAGGMFPDEMKPYAAMFGYFDVEKEIKAGRGFSDKFIHEIQDRRVVPFYQNRRFWYYFSGAAAVLLFLLTFFYETGNIPPKKQYTSEETLQAYLQTKKTLAYVSEKFNKGVNPLNEIGKINQNTQRLSKISKFDQNINKVNNNVKKMESGFGNISKLSKFNIIIKP